MFGVQSSFRVRLASRKGAEPSFSSSMVNLIVGRIPLRWCSGLSTASFIMQPVSSTYCFHGLSLEGAESKVSSLKNSMYNVTTIIETGEPMAKSLPLLVKLTIVAEVDRFQAEPKEF